VLTSFDKLRMTSFDKLRMTSSNDPRRGKMPSAQQEGVEVTVLLRPEAARLVEEQEETGAVNLLRGEVVTRSFRGTYYRLVVRHASGIALVFELEGAGDALPGPGQVVTLSLRPQAIQLLEADPAQKDKVARGTERSNFV
jgi:ABC-type Fe3+/spermidine/putrescine transport system ATPase subunit